jgi:hypothetical protein
MQRDALIIKHIVPSNWCHRGNQWRTTRLSQRKRRILHHAPVSGDCSWNPQLVGSAHPLVIKAGNESLTPVEQFPSLAA